MERSSNKQIVKMDSRKFLGALNDSAQAKVAMFEERIQQMGKSAGKQWRLAALHARNLFIEDVNTHEYFQADHSREQHGRVNITNIRPIKIVEEEKRSMFLDTCAKLVSAIEENDQKGMQVAFDRMKAQRFSSRAVPACGIVKCRDGVVRNVSVSNENVSLEHDVKTKLVATIVESLRDRVIVENGSVVSGNFADGAPVHLPVTKWASRKLVARRMMEAAKNAYWSEGFQNRILEISKLVAEGEVEKAVKTIVPFLEEMEEFTLLNRAQVQTLVENALAAKAVFNQQLCEDTATLFFRTNMKISRSKIIDEWRNIARRSEHPVLAENVTILEEAKNFESSYQKFLQMIFEAISNREVAAEALATTLGALKDKTPKIKESHDLSSKLNSLIVRLKDRNPDDAAIYEAEDLIATIQEELAASDSLQNFDQMPTPGGPDMGMGGELGGDLGGATAGGSGAPVININSPLIQIGGSSTGGAAGGAPPAPEAAPMEAPAPGGDEDLDALLGGAPAPAAPAPGAPAPGAPAPGAPAQAAAAPAPGAPGAPILQSKTRGASINESRPPHYEMQKAPKKTKKGHTDHYCQHDPYAYDDVKSEGYHITNYGAPVITDDGDLDRILGLMRRLAVENKLTGAALEHNLPAMAKASIKAVGLRLPSGSLGTAVEQVTSTFLEYHDLGNEASAAFGKKHVCDDECRSNGCRYRNEEDGEGEEGMAEEQYKSPRIKKRGLAKSSINPSKKVRNESIVWKDSQEDAILGECSGVRFILDHGGSANLNPVILSEDGSVEIPVPEELTESALAAARLIDGDGTQFTSWLSGSIEQLRPITDADELSLNEAMAKITTGPDGELNVEVSDDVSVGQADDDQETVILGDESSGEEERELAPVDSLDIGGKVSAADDEDHDDTDEMPDFEAKNPFKKESMDEVKHGHEEEEEEEEEHEGEDKEEWQRHEEHETEEEEEEEHEEEEEEEEEEEHEEEEEEHEEEEDDEEGLAEDHEVTDPSQSKYTKHVKDNYREVPKHKLPEHDSGDELEDIGPDVDEDDGKGTNPKTARKS